MTATAHAGAAGVDSDTTDDGPPAASQPRSRPAGPRHLRDSDVRTSGDVGADAGALGGSEPGLDRILVAAVDVVRRHPWVVGAAAMVFLFVKVIRVSRTNPATAMTLLTSADASTITLGGLLSLLYTATLTGIVAGLCVVGRRHRGVTGHVVASMGVLALSMTAGLLLLPLPAVGAAAVVALAWRVVDAAIRRLPYPKTGPRLRTRVGRLALVAATSACSAMTVWAFVDEVPWVAAEHLETTDGPIVGYVVNTGDWITVLTEERRTIVRLRDTDIKTRQVCDLDQRASLRTLPQVLSAEGGAGRYPPCP